jgi:aryl-alcohol dehydrogenase-like predicted oxidoreductase
MPGPPAGSRIREAEKEGWSESWSNYDHEHTWRVIDALLAEAEEAGRSPAQVAINWLRQRPGVTCPVVGARTLAQLEDNLGATTWSLGQEQIERLNTASELTAPRYPYGFIYRFNEPFT